MKSTFTLRCRPSGGFSPGLTNPTGFLLLILISFLSRPALSQKLRIAPTLGLNTSTVAFSEAYRNSLNSSLVSTTFGITARWQAGALLDYAFTDRFSVRTGLLFTGKGSNVRFTGYQTGYTPVTIRGGIQLNYLEVPLLLTVAVGSKGLRLVGGPVVSIALNGRFTSDGGSYYGSGYYGSNEPLPIGTNATDGLLPFELSATLGLVREMKLADRTLELGLYSQPSLTNWDPGVRIRPDYTARNGLFGVKVAYFFALPR